MSRASSPVALSWGARELPNDKAPERNSPTTDNNNSKGRPQAKRRHYVTRARVEAVARQLSVRDRQLVEDVARLHAVSGQQLRRLHYSDTSSGRRLARLDLARLAKLHVVARLERRVGGIRAGSEGYVYVLDVVAQRLSFPERRRYRAPWTPSPAFMAHTLAIAELYTELRERAESLELLTFDSEPTCWRTFSGPGGRRLTLKPDAFLICADQHYEYRYFIEVDCSTESLPRILEKARLYVRHWSSGREQAENGIYPQVLWIAPTESRQDRITEALAQLDAEYWHLFAVTEQQEAAQRIGSTGARI